MKKIAVLVLLLLLFSAIILYKNSLVYFYCNPYTSTSGLQEISYTIKEITKGLNYAKISGEKSGKKYNYLFWNAYGSGFLNNNPIPNDLDLAVGIDLGEFDYDTKNKDIIADEIVEKIGAFQYSFNFYINTMEKRIFYSPFSPLETLSKYESSKTKYKSCITNHFEEALSKKEYVIYAEKNLENADHRIKMDIPYLMRPKEILLEDCSPIILYSDIMSYNSKMQPYIREISIIPEYYITVKYNDEKVRIELVPESYIGDRLQISRKFFAPNVYAGYFSRDFIKNLPFIKNDEEYLFYRMFSYKRHLQEVENFYDLKYRPIKLLKRIMQTADIAYPLLGKETHEEISNFVLENLSNTDLQLLNEYENICKIFLNTTQYPKLYINLLEDGKIKTIYDKIGDIIEYLEANGNIDKKSLEVLKNYYKNELTTISNMNNITLINDYRTQFLLPDYEQVSMTIDSVVYKGLKDYNNIEKYIDIFEKIYTGSGYHKITVCWLDKDSAGIVKDEFTSHIKDLKNFAKENGLADVDYKLIKSSQIPPMHFSYIIWAKYNPAGEELNSLTRLNQTLLDDRKNFYIKKKIVFWPNKH